MLPLGFEPNRGQTNSQVQFLSRGSGYTLFLTPTEAVLALREPTTAQDRKQPAAEDSVAEGQKAAMQRSFLRMKLVGGSSAPQVEGQDELPGRSNYFIGNDPSKWRTDVPNYAKVQYKEVYPGVNVEYHGNHRQLEYDFLIAPGADPHSIKLAFEGVEKIRLAPNGDLALLTPQGEVLERKPLVYQEVNGIKQILAGRYVLVAKNQICFEVADYDRSKPLTIDPVLAHSTYLGGAGEDDADAIAVDSSGNAYVAGVTSSIDFPTTSGAYQTAHTGSDYDGYVTKMNATGSALVYSTYIGGHVPAIGNSADDFLNSIAVDSAGNAYVAGDTVSSDFPTTPGAYSAFWHGGQDAFFAKLNDTGSALLYSTYFGGSGNDNINPIAVDSAGNAYVTGYTTSGDFPITPGAYMPFKPAPASSLVDAFVAKFDPTASGAASLVYSTYLGGGGNDIGFGIAVDSIGAAYVSGGTRSANFPTTPGAFQTTFGGGPPCTSSTCGDAFVTKLNPTGSALVYSTYLGGFGADFSFAIAIDASGNAYVTGGTFSNNFPTTSGAFQRTIAGFAPCGDFYCGEAFMTKLNAAGSGILYSTYLGGSGGDLGLGIAVNSSGEAYISGMTSSSNFPIKDAIQPTFGGGHTDAFLVKLNPAGAGASDLVYSTYLGGSGDEIVVVQPPGSPSTFIAGGVVALDSCGNAHVAGITSSLDFPTKNPYQSSNAGFIDSFVAKIVVDTTPPTITCPADMTVSQDSAYGAIISFSPPIASDNCPGVTTTCAPASGSVFPLGTTPVTCTAIDVGGNTASCSFNVTVVPPMTTVGLKSTDGGSIRIPGGIGTFGIVAMATSKGFVSGDVEYQDHVTGMNVKSTVLTAIVVTGTHARIFGKATINGSGSYDFVVDVDDLGEPGIGVDKFGIQISNGYNAGPALLSGGNIQIHR
jgi:hypothetical protein